MGKQDGITKRFLQNPAECADIVNLALYGGAPVIAAEDVSELDGTETAIIGYRSGSEKHGRYRQESLQRYRDVLKYVAKEGEGFGLHLIAGVEGQSAVQYAMPVRDGLYDFMNYADQVKRTEERRRSEKTQGSAGEFLSGFGRDDRLTPVITIVVYFGSQAWDAARSLHEMLDWTGIPPEARDKIPDYKLLLIEPHGLTDEVLDSLPSCLGGVLGAIKHSGSKEEFRAYLERKQFRRFPAYAAAVLNEFCALEIPEETLEGGDVDMCQAVLEIKEEGREEGRREGIRALIEACRDFGVSYEDTKARLIEKLSLTEEEAEENMKRYWQGGF